MTFQPDGPGLIHDIDVRLTVELGRRTMRLRDILSLQEGGVVELDRLIDEPLDILVNGTCIARGEVVAEGNRFAIRIIEVLGAAGSASSALPADRRAQPITASFVPAGEPA